MATANNTIKTRIQLKNDTETNWNELGPKNGSSGFIPLKGEIIVYSPDNKHNYSRLKIGDGQTNIVDLPFMDAATFNGNEEFIYKYNNFNSFPDSGSSKCLYLDLSTNEIYYYDATLGYTIIAPYLNTTQDVATRITEWRAGGAATAEIKNNVLVLTNGVIPKLTSVNFYALTGIQTGGNNQ